MVERDITKRWEAGIPHHTKSIELAESISYIDYYYGGDSFVFKFGGDGDNGETLMYLMDIYFECLDSNEELYEEETA